MKTIVATTLFLVLVLACLACVALAQGPVYVQPYTDNSGHRVEGHYRSAPDSNPYNNWSSQGNVNPYTGQRGTVNPDRQQTSPYSFGNPYQQQNRNSNLFGK